MPQDFCGGVKCFSIAGRMIEERERCMGLTDEERRWRAQWLKDQVLSPDEPRYVPEHYKAVTNVIRRLWKTPMNKLQLLLEGPLGKNGAFYTRHAIGRISIGLLLSFATVYYVKYVANDFTTFRTLEIFKVQSRMYPYEPDYPNFPQKDPIYYYDHGFHSSVLCQDVEPLEKIPPPEEEPVKPEEEDPCAEEEEEK